MKEIEYFRTNDLALATTLVCLGLSIERLNKEDPKKVVFIFKKTVALEAAINNYWNNRCAVNPKEFFNTQKELKARIYSSR